MRILSISFIFLTFICSGCIRDNSPEGDFILKAGDELPIFSVTMNDGTEITNRTLCGKVSIIVFFNTECPDCRKELPVIQEVYDTFKESEDIRIIAISREQKYNDVQHYWTMNGLSIPFSAQADEYIYKKFSNKGIPLIYIVGRNLIINKVWKENEYADKEQIIKAIKVLHNQSTIKTNIANYRI